MKSRKTSPAALARAAVALCVCFAIRTNAPVVCLAAATPDAAVAHAAHGDKPNIILYVVDTLRADELGCYGGTATKTPNFDRLAAEGALFANVSAVASATRPSMASILTGVPADVHGAYEGTQSLLVHSGKMPRLAEILSKSGYYTAGITANPNLAEVFGFKQGFEYYEEAFAAKSRERAPGEEEDQRMISDAPVMVEKIKKFVEGAPSDKPFFLLAMTIDPHAPYTPPAPYETMYDPQASGERDGSMAFLQRAAVRLRRNEKVDLSRARALYRGEISYADHHFGELLDWLKATGRLDKTLVILTSDHGEEFAEHANRGHGHTVFQELTHVPLILRYPPMFKAGVRRDDLADLLDLSATLAAVGGAQRPSVWHGRDLRGPVSQRPVFAAQRARGAILTSVRHGELKLIRNEARGKTDAYDLREDPGEQRPLTGERAEKALKDLAPRIDDYKKTMAALRNVLVGGGDETSEKDVPPDVLRALKALGYVE